MHWVFQRDIYSFCREKSWSVFWVQCRRDIPSKQELYSEEWSWWEGWVLLLLGPRTSGVWAQASHFSEHTPWPREPTLALVSSGHFENCKERKHYNSGLTKKDGSCWMEVHLILCSQTCHHQVWWITLWCSHSHQLFCTEQRKWDSQLLFSFVINLFKPRQTLVILSIDRRNSFWLLPSNPIYNFCQMTPNISQQSDIFWNSFTIMGNHKCDK